LIDHGRLAVLGSPRELERGSIKGQIILIESDDVGALLPVLETMDGIRDVAPFGSSLHVMVDSAVSAIPAIERLFVERGLHYSRIERIVPTLEDVFVQVVASASTTERFQ
jgi:ABC-2 type transport system ATP-binding protein